MYPLSLTAVPFELMLCNWIAIAIRDVCFCEFSKRTSFYALASSYWAIVAH